MTVHDLLLKGIDVEFRIDRSLQANQNTADLTVYNLNPDNRKRLAALKTVTIEIKAGYKGPSPVDPASDPLRDLTGESPEDPALIFRGSLREVTNLREGADWLTRISSGDGDEARKSPVSFSLGPGASFEAATKKVIQGMGVGVGNALQSIKDGKFADASNQFVNGLTVHGNSAEELERLLKSAGMDYSIQNGDLQVLPEGKALNTSAVLLTPATGLIGSPERGDKGRLKFRSLMNAQIFPGRKVKIQTENLDNVFRVERAVYIGQTRGNDWYVDCEGRPVQ